MEAPIPDGARVPLVVVAGAGNGAEAALVARRAIALGLSVTVASPQDDHAAIVAAGARPVLLAAGSANPMRAGYAAGELAAAMKAGGAGIVHCLGLPAILIGGTAAVLAGIPARVFAFPATDGVLARRGWTGSLARRFVGGLVRGPLAGARTRFVFADAASALVLGFDPGDPRTRLGDAADAVHAELVAL